MRRRNRLITLLAMPLAVFFWVIGWSLSWIGSRERKVEPRKKPTGKELSFVVLTPEQKFAE